MQARLIALVTLTLAASSARAQEGELPAELAALVRSHANEQALAAIATLSSAEQQRARARYLRARLLDRLGRFAEAASAYPADADAAPLPAHVRRDSARRRAVALARSGQCALARDQLAPFASEPLVQARLAECALAAGDLPAAVDGLREVVGRGARDVDEVAARLALAEALARSGARDEAVDLLTALVVERPDHPEAAQTMAALEGLRGVRLALSFDQRLRRAERFRSERRYVDALAEIDAVPRPRDPAELRRWIHLRGMTLFDSRRHYREAADVLRESATLGGPHVADDQFHAARALSRADRDLEAVTAYRRFAAEHASHRSAPEALYLAAWLELRHGVRGAEARMQRFLRSPHAGRAPELAREGRWQLALRAFERGRHARAAQLFEEYAATDPAPLVRGRGLYWLGRARHASDDRPAAIAAYRQALRVEPLHWYALLSRQRLVELGEDPGSPFPSGPAAGEASAPAESLPQEVSFYASIGLRADAREALRAHERALRRGDGGLAALVAAYTSLGEPARLRQLAASARLLRSGHAPGPTDRWQWNAAYPRPWPTEVQAAARAVALEPAHIYAIMWQESGFDSDAVSYADAIGLMQLLPATADRVAERAGVELTRDMLFEPAINIRLGAAYVGGLAEHFGVPLCFAAFNAGGNRVSGWLEAQGETELDLFVERIPIEQTRNYTRRVTTHLAHYRYLEDPTRGWPIDLPRTVAPR